MTSAPGSGEISAVSSPRHLDMVRIRQMVDRLDQKTYVACIVSPGVTERSFLVVLILKVPLIRPPNVHFRFQVQGIVCLRCPMTPALGPSLQGVVQLGLPGSQDRLPSARGLHYRGQQREPLGAIQAKQEWGCPRRKELLSGQRSWWDPDDQLEIMTEDTRADSQSLGAPRTCSSHLAAMPHSRNGCAQADVHLKRDNDQELRVKSFTQSGSIFID